MQTAMCSLATSLRITSVGRESINWLTGQGMKETLLMMPNMGKERRCAYLSGPSFAREIMAGEATAVVIASEDGLAGELSKIMSSSQFRCHTSRDIKVRHQILLFQTGQVHLG